MVAGDPYTKTEIQAALREQSAELERFFGSIPDNLFFQRPTQGWSAATNVRHLHKAGLALLLGLWHPPWLLRLLFGKSKTAPRRLSAVRADYLARLKAGAGAGIYAPLIKTSPPRAGKKEALLQRWVRTGDRIARALDQFSDAELDSLRLPHPILGRTVLREMALFHILHNEHHSSIVKARMSHQETRA